MPDKCQSLLDLKFRCQISGIGHYAQHGMLCTSGSSLGDIYTDSISMEKDADKMAEQADNSSKLTLLAKSNALLNAAK